MTVIFMTAMMTTMTMSVGTQSYTHVHTGFGIAVSAGPTTTMAAWFQ